MFVYLIWNFISSNLCLPNLFIIILISLYVIVCFIHYFYDTNARIQDISNTLTSFLW
jgi:hypothetical protein